MADWVTLNTSPLNFMEEVRRETHLPRKVYLHDNTLRDGEQFAGVEFTKGEKIRIARALNDYGVHRIEVMPAVSREDMEATAQLNAMGLSSEIVGFCRSVQEDVQKAADAGCKSVVIEILSHPPVLQALGWSFEMAAGKMIEISHFAKSKGLRVTAMFVLVTQAPLDFSRKFIQKIIAGDRRPVHPRHPWHLYASGDLSLCADLEGLDGQTRRNPCPQPFRHGSRLRPGGRHGRGGGRPRLRQRPGGRRGKRSLGGGCHGPSAGVGH